MTDQDYIGNLVMQLGLTRPLVFLDLESTQEVEDVDPHPERDRIIEVAVLKVYLDGRVTTFDTLVNPGIPITKTSQEHHGITDEAVAQAPTWREVGPKILGGLKDADLAAYNGRRYDRRLLDAESRRHKLPVLPECRIVDPFLIWQKKAKRDLAAAVKEFCGEDHDGHRSGADVAAVVLVLMAQLERWPDLPRTVQGLDEFGFPRDPRWIDPEGKFRWSGDVPVVGFGEHDGKSMKSMDAGFWRWMLKPGKDFPPAAKRLAQDALEGRFPVRLPIEQGT